MSNCLVPRAVILWTGPETLSTWKLWTTGPGASIAREADLCDYGGVRVVYFGMRVLRTLMHPRDEERETRSVTKDQSWMKSARRRGVNVPAAK